MRAALRSAPLPAALLLQPGIGNEADRVIEPYAWPWPGVQRGLLRGGSP